MAVGVPNKVKYNERNNDFSCDRWFMERFNC